MSDETDKKAAALALSVKTIRDNIIALVEIEQLQARLTRARYLALIQNGFTEAQALQLAAKRDAVS